MIDRSCFDKTKEAGLVGWWDRINNRVGINHKKVPERKKRKEKRRIPTFQKHSINDPYPWRKSEKEKRNEEFLALIGKE